MEDNNNLEDFFRKRLSSVDDKDVSWFNPDPMTDQLVLGKLVASKNGSRSKKISRALLALLFLLLLGYIAHLKYSLYHLSNAKTAVPATISNQQIATLNPIDPKTSEIENNVTITTKNKASDSDSSNPEEKSILDKELKKRTLAENHLLAQNNYLEAEKKALLAKNKALQSLFQEQKQKILALENELKNSDCYNNNNNNNNNTHQSPILANQEDDKHASDHGNNLGTTKTSNALEDSLALANLNENEATNNSKLDEAALFADLASIRPKLFPLTIEPETVETDIPFLIQKKKRRIHSLEFGMEVSLHGLITPINRSIENQRLAVANAHSATLVMPMHGINLAYSPVKNFWLRLGARIGVNNSTLQHKLGVIYNDAEQYNLSSGAKGHDFVLNTHTDYTESIDKLKLTIPQNINNGDLFELDYFETYDLVRVQVPITAEYYFGSKKFQPMVHLGFQWNMLQYKHEVFSMNITSRDQNVDFSTTAAPESKATDIHFMGFSTGVGLNWNLRPHFSLRGQLAYETNFLLKDIQGTEGVINSGFACKFGLYFKF